ncbi:response regulator [Rhizobium leguminosarum]|uniref:response regulator n=1 Tax=Rhizobium TaxID=379 RepID=UPI00103AEB7E|nr:response regulator [Rhizobium leguminosarum]TCA65152.1 response regulator [Rhizobium leguminosarum bv. viciae]
MNYQHILFVDDDDLNQEMFTHAIEEWNEKHEGENRKYLPRIATNYEEALDALRIYRIDCALLDLRLPEKTDDEVTADVGNKLAHDVLFAQGLPLAVLSGNPAEIDLTLTDLELIQVFNKGAQNGFESALDWLADKWHMMDTLRVAKTSIEHTSAEVFAKRLWPQWSAFASLEGNQDKLSRIISRQYVSHIADILGQDNEQGVGWHPFENYNVPSLFDSRAHTGDIFDTEGGLWIVLSPQCDMATQKVPNVILAGCERGYERWAENVETLKTTTSEGARKKASSYFRKLVNQNLPSSEHFLPPLPGEDLPLLVTFGHLKTIPLEELNKMLDRRVASVSSPFVSNLIQRFGAFISRTGQPNLEVDHFAS